MIKIRAIYLAFTINIAIILPFATSAQEVRDITFPIDPEYEYQFSDTYGAARSGGRSHIGTDIMVDQMTPLVSAVDGRVSYLVDQDKGWGLAIYVEDSDGYSYRYLHVNNDTPGTDDGKEIRAYAFPRDIQRGSQVKAGQVIAYAGDSGNAEWVAHHLHFEIWTPQREVVNAYPSLMAAIGQPLPSVDEDQIVASYNFTRDLDLGSEGEDVRQLQIYLNQAGFIVSESGAGSIGNETTYFGPATQEALIRFQRAKGISPAAGYFGSLTRDYIGRNQVVIEEEQSEVSDEPYTTDVQAGWLVKDNVLPRVYYVNNDLELQWIVDEEAARKNFGEQWYLEVKSFEDLEAMDMRFGDYIR